MTDEVDDVKSKADELVEEIDYLRRENRALLDVLIEVDDTLHDFPMYRSELVRARLDQRRAELKQGSR